MSSGRRRDAGHGSGRPGGVQSCWTPPRKDLRNGRAVRRLCLVGANRRARRPGGKEIERVEHQRCRPFVSKNVIVGLGLEKARVGGVLLPGTPCPARVVERAFALRDGDEGRSRMCVPTGASAGVDGYLLKRSVARGRRATGRQLFHGLDLNLDPPRIGPGQKLLVSETTPSKQSAHSLP